MTAPEKTKPFEIPKQEVFAAWKRVKANKGAAGVDEESIAEFEANLSSNLYKLWNRMFSGSYFPKAVRRVEIPKKDGGTRPLGIPTVSDRIAQEVVRARLEIQLEPLFHEDSYGYRPGKSAIDAIRTCRERNWKYDWVLELDIKKCFDTIPHGLLLKAVCKHCSEKWMLLYIERWLKAEIWHPDGKIEISTKGTPQGGVASPLLATLYLHYVFDKWMGREFPNVMFERYADDGVCHCRNLSDVQELKKALTQRFADCELELHPDKTRIVYCKRDGLKEDFPTVSFKFLGYTFQPRMAIGRNGKPGLTFVPAASKDAQSHLLKKLKAKKIRRLLTASIEEIAQQLNPLLRGWFNYFSKFYKSKLTHVYFQVDRYLAKWAQAKYRMGIRQAAEWLKRLKYRTPALFAHWQILGT